MNVGKINCAPLKPQAYANSPSFGNSEPFQDDASYGNLEKGFTDFYSTHKKIKTVEIPVSDNREELIGQIIAKDLANKRGEIIIESGKIINGEDLEAISEIEPDKLLVYAPSPKNFDNALAALALGAIGALAAKRSVRGLLNLGLVDNGIAKLSTKVNELNIGKRTSEFISSGFSKGFSAISSKIKPESKLQKVLSNADAATSFILTKTSDAFSKITKFGLKNIDEIPAGAVAKNTITNAATIAGATVGMKTALQDNNKNGVSDVKEKIGALNTFASLVTAASGLSDF